MVDFTVEGVHGRVWKTSKNQGKERAKHHLLLSGVLTFPVSVLGCGPGRVGNDGELDKRPHTDGHKVAIGSDGIGSAGWAVMYNVLAIPLAAAGAMAFSSVSVVGNSLRLQRRQT